MFDANIFSAQQGTHFRQDRAAAGRSAAHSAALRLYANTRLHSRLAALFGRSLRLPDLASLTRHSTLKGQHAAGLQTVRIDQIRGSEGRSQDFDASFRPLSEHTKQRWLSVASAWFQGLTLPPVELIQVGDSYFVRDGHHRVSVARAAGQQQIEAEVLVWQVAENPAPAPFFNCPALAPTTA
jgi:hypothetical protein